MRRPRIFQVFVIVNFFMWAAGMGTAALMLAEPMSTKWLLIVVMWVTSIPVLSFYALWWAVGGKLR